MKIKHFSILLTLSVLMISLFVCSVFFHYVYLPRLQSEHLELQKRELKGIQIALDYAQKDLETLVRDYAVWDDMVDMVHGVSKFDALDSETMLRSYELANIDAVYLFDSQGEVKFRYSFMPDLNLERAAKENIWKGAVLPSESLVQSNSFSQRSGLLFIGDTPFYYSNAVVLPSIGEGEIAGSLMMLRALDEDVIEVIQDITLTQFVIEVVNQTTFDKKIKLFNRDSDIEKPASTHEWLVTDVFGRPAFYLRLLHNGNYNYSFFSIEAFVILLAFLIVSLAGMIPSIMIMLKPMQRINLVLNKMVRHGGVVKVPTDMFIDEVRRLAISFNYSLDKIDRHQNYLESLAIKDPLTGIANRRGLEAFAERAFQQWREGQGCIGFLMIDIDDFKPYNDSLGHPAGDRVILDIAQVLMLECRRRGELVTRYGGEEFCVIIHGNSTKQMELLGERMLKKVREMNIPHPVATASDIVTVSIGSVFFERCHPQFAISSWQQMLEVADRQLYSAKEQGKDRMCARYESTHLKVIP